MSFYKILGVSRNATSAEVKAAYISMVKKWHPDKNPAGDPEAAKRKLQAVNNAYATLSNENLRRDYDIRMDKRRTEKVNPTPPPPRPPPPRYAPPPPRYAPPPPRPPPSPNSVDLSYLYKWECKCWQKPWEEPMTTRPLPGLFKFIFAAFFNKIFSRQISVQRASFTSTGQTTSTTITKFANGDILEVTVRTESSGKVEIETILNGKLISKKVIIPSSRS